MTKVSKRGMNRLGAAAVGLSMAVAGCSSEPEPEAAEPVFAIERDVVSNVQPLALIDPTAEIQAADLRLLLQALLTEHSTLSIEAMRIGIDGGDTSATVEQLTANTDGLTGAIGLIYGKDGAFAFDQLWTSHIEFFNDYGSALGTGDEFRLESVQLELGHYESDFSSYIEAATAGELDVHTVEHVLHSHVQQLLDQADAWAEGRYDDAYAIQLEAHDHADVIAAALATGFSIQNPELLPGEVSTPANDQCAAAQLRASAALYFEAEALIVEKAGRSDRSAAADAAASSAVAAAGEVVATASAVGAAIETLRADVAEADLSALPAARDVRAAELSTLLVDDCF